MIEDSFRVHEVKREANMYVSDIVFWRFLNLVSTLADFLEISKILIDCSSYVAAEIG